MTLEDIDNLLLIENNFVHMEFELARPAPSYFRIAREAHYALYRSMIEALRGTANLSVTGRPDKERIHRYQFGDGPSLEIRKESVEGCKQAWRFSKPIPCDPLPSNQPCVDPPESDFLIGFFDALAMIQCECFMGQYTHSQIIQVSNNEMRILEWLHQNIRNEFEHFIPRFYSAPTSSLAQAAAVCIRLTRALLFQSGNVLHNESEDTLKQIITRVLEKLPGADGLGGITSGSS